MEEKIAELGRRGHDHLRQHFDPGSRGGHTEACNRPPRKLINDDFRPIATVHDELIFEAIEGKADHFKEVLETEMRLAAESVLSKVPVKCDANVGDSGQKMNLITVWLPKTKSVTSSPQN